MTIQRESTVIHLDSGIQWVTAEEECIVIGLESFSMELSVRVAGNTSCAQTHARAWRIEAVWRICAV
jgi:hypothetical protein